MQNPKNKYIRLYTRAWKRLESITPLKRDCGELCDRKCCSGTESDGMLLFPGEEFMYQEPDRDWFHIQDSNITLPDGYRIKLLICERECPRDKRPLSCRIFPVTPYLNKDNRVEFRLDLRSLGICPIVFNPGVNPVEEDFIESLYDTFPPLLHDDRIIEFIEILSRQLDELSAFLEKFQSTQQSGL